MIQQAFLILFGSICQTEINVQWEAGNKRHIFEPRHWCLKYQKMVNGAAHDITVLSPQPLRVLRPDSAKCFDNYGNILLFDPMKLDVLAIGQANGGIAIWIFVFFH